MTLKEQRFRLLEVATQLAAASVASGKGFQPYQAVCQASQLISEVTKKLPKVTVK